MDNETWRARPCGNFCKCVFLYRFAVAVKMHLELLQNDYYKSLNYNYLNRQELFWYRDVLVFIENGNDDVGFSSYDKVDGKYALWVDNYMLGSLPHITCCLKPSSKIRSIRHTLSII